jgi:DNA gyrase subunit B
VTSGEYRTLAAAYREIERLRFPVVVNVSDPKLDEPVESPSADGADEGDLEATSIPTATRPAAGSRKEADGVTLDTLDDFVDYFIAAGRKGVAINRYKGLGEMNPETLWITTMNPENRTLLQVRAEDHAEADQMFTTLMGDQVEPRRKFIEDNALDVRNLDV